MTDSNNSDKPKRLPRLQTPFEVSRFLARIVRELYLDKLSETKAGKLGYLCGQLVRALEQIELSKRLEEKEEDLQKVIELLQDQVEKRD